MAVVCFNHVTPYACDPCEGCVVALLRGVVAHFASILEACCLLQLTNSHHCCGLPLQVPALEADGRLLDVQKLLLTAAAATQNTAVTCSVSRCLQSAAQELRCLQVSRGWYFSV